MRLYRPFSGLYKNYYEKYPVFPILYAAVSVFHVIIYIAVRVPVFSSGGGGRAFGLLRSRTLRFETYRGVFVSFFVGVGGEEMYSVFLRLARGGDGAISFMTLALGNSWSSSCACGN